MIQRLAPRRSEAGVVGVNLTVTIAFALYAVIMLSWTTLSAKQIDDRVRVILGEVGPGTNVAGLDRLVILDEVGATAEGILAAARPLENQVGQIVNIVGSIDRTVSAINGNANEINTTVKSINSSLSAALPVVRTINGDGSDSNLTGGVDFINRQAAAAAPVVGGISDDLGRVFGLVGPGGNTAEAHSGTGIHAHVNSIDCSVVVNLAGLSAILGGVLGASSGCNAL